ncbi:MAG: hypothetical protein U1E53_15920 [Dongiaceae bacterium]
MQQAGQHGGGQGRRLRQPRRLEAQPGRIPGRFPGGVEQRAERSAGAPGAQRRREVGVGEQGGEPAQRALRARLAGQRVERGPDGRGAADRLLRPGRRQQPEQPVQRPAPLGRELDGGERLEQRLAPRPQRDLGAAHRQGGGERALAALDQDDAAAGIAAGLQCQQGEQRRAGRPGRADHQLVRRALDREGQPERRAVGAARLEQRRRPVAGRRAGPARGEWQQLRHAEPADRRPADIGIGLAGQRGEPGRHRVQGLAPGDQPVAVEQLLDRRGRRVGDGRVGVPQRHRGVVIGGAEPGIPRLGPRLGPHLRQQRRDAAAPREPGPRPRLAQPPALRRVERDGPRRPAIFQPEPVERVEQRRGRGARHAGRRDDPEVAVAKPRLRPALERLGGEQLVEIGGGFRHRHRPRRGRDGGGEPGEQRRVGQRLGLGQQPGEHPGQPVHAVLEGAERVAARLAARPQVLNGEVVVGDEGGAGPLERLAPLRLDQPADRIGKALGRRRVGQPPAARLEMQRPAAAELGQRRRQAAGLGRGGAVERGLRIVAAEADRGEEGAVLVEHDAGRHQRRPGQQVAEPLRLRPIFPEERHPSLGRGGGGAGRSPRRSSAGSRHAGSYPSPPTHRPRLCRRGSRPVKPRPAGAVLPPYGQNLPLPVKAFGA